jgi:hypothetical protein
MVQDAREYDEADEAESAGDDGHPHRAIAWGSPGKADEAEETKEGHELERPRAIAKAWWEELAPVEHQIEGQPERCRRCRGSNQRRTRPMVLPHALNLSGAGTREQRTLGGQC